MYNEQTPLLEFSESGVASSVPVTFVSGFLASGKTTLIRHILNTNLGNLCSSYHRDLRISSEPMRIAVLISDMGSINIDVKRIKTEFGPSFRENTSDLVELANGCFCCSLRPTLLRELMGLVKQSSIDYIIVEGSGIADPKSITNIFNEAGLWSVRLDTIVTIVDSEKFFQDFLLTSTKKRYTSLIDMRIDQIKMANVIILNKIDLITQIQKNTILKEIRILNPKAKLLSVSYSHVPLREVLGTRLYQKPVVPFSSAFSPRASIPTSLAQTTEQSINTSLASICTFTYISYRPFHPQRLHNMVVTWKSNIILRSKGIVWIASSQGMDEYAYWTHIDNYLVLECGVRWMDKTISCIKNKVKFGSRCQKNCFYWNWYG